MLLNLQMSEQGFAIGNGLTDPEIQYKAYPDYALDMGLITAAEYKRLNLVLVPVCEASIKLCGNFHTQIHLSFSDTSIFPFRAGHMGLFILYNSLYIFLQNFLYP